MDSPASVVRTGVVPAAPCSPAGRLYRAASSTSPPYT